MSRGRDRQAPRAWFARLASEQRDEFEMEGVVNPLHHVLCHVCKTWRLTQLLDDFTEQPVGVIALAEEAAIERVEPALAPYGRRQRQRSDSSIDPTARAQDVRERLLAVQKQ
jgi:hypothetical protein